MRAAAWVRSGRGLAAGRAVFWRLAGECSSVWPPFAGSARSLCSAGALLPHPLLCPACPRWDDISKILKQLEKEEAARALDAESEGEEERP